MSSLAAEARPFIFGTTGWTAPDLEDPDVEAKWLSGRYEIIQGVLTQMAAAYYRGSTALDELIFVLKTHLKSRGLESRFAHELDIVIDESRVVLADAAWLTEEDRHKQSRRAKETGSRDPGRTRCLIPPSLVIESISPGHERHDQQTKRNWYAEFGVPNYWILDGFRRTLQCLILDGDKYRLDVEGRDADQLRPALFPGITISLGEIWEK